MGDYTKNGVKIGTCGAAYYATLEMLEMAAANGANDPEINHYINPQNGCRFAFPFPEYEGKKIGEISNFHEGERAEFTFHFKTDEHYHKEIYQHHHPKGAPGVNVKAICPQDHQAPEYYGIDKKEPIFRLKEQIFEDGKLKLLAECVYCGNGNVFSDSEALRLAEQLREEAEKEVKIYKNANFKYPDSERVIKAAEYTQKIVAKILEMIERNQKEPATI